MSGAAYLHNALDDQAVVDLRDPQDRYGRLFTGAGRARWLDHLKTLFDPAVAGAPHADLLVGSAAAPSQQLLTVAADEVQTREEFVLLAEQKLAYELVIHEVERARRGDTTSVVLVTGGPGSGKSVIALSLLGDLARRGRTVAHATGSPGVRLNMLQPSGTPEPFSVLACAATSLARRVLVPRASTSLHHYGARPTSNT